MLLSTTSGNVRLPSFDLLINILTIVKYKYMFHFNNTNGDTMKKYIWIGFVITLLIVSTGNAIANNDKIQTASKEFTHTVFAEECTATWCPNCPYAAEALYNIYQSGDYPFYYVALVNDMSPIAKDRNRDYSFGFIKVFAFPTVYFDGGDTIFVGRENNASLTEAQYRPLIEQEGARTPKQPITMNSSVTWNGNAKLTITINIKNEGNLPYFGKCRSYVTEIVSRWNNNFGNPYHFALLDYAVNKYVLLMPKITKTITGTFDGNANHGNQTFEDITQDNIMVISSLSNWHPHYRTGYESDQYNQKYFAHFVDQTTATTPT
jgi:thiol-disulfide isomerase/thioredoxin